MDRFDKETIQLLSLLFVGLTIYWYLAVAVRTRKKIGDASIRGFLRYGGDDEHTPSLSADVLHASLMGSAFSLASAVYVYLNWAASDGAFALWSPITWTLGAVILFVLRARIFRESRNTWTLHGFLQNKYDSVALKRLASIITSAVFLLQVVAEVYVGLAVLQVFVGHEVPLWILCLATGTVFLSYSVIGGLPAILITDEVKYRLIVFALLVAGVALLDHGGASAMQLIEQSMATKFMPSSTQWIVLFSLLALNLPIFVTDMSVWQRVGAITSEREVTRGLGRFAAMLLPWMVGIIFVGIGFGSVLVPPEGWSTAQAILGFFSDSLILSFF
jgi:Na+/proline symporter